MSAEKMKILFAASEMAPFFKTGGLGDVIGSLPTELKNKGTDTRVVIPFYKNINNKYEFNTDRLKFVTEVNVGKNKQNKSAKIYELDYEIPVYFVENDYYFNRPNIYGYEDDGERFAFFSKVVLDFLPCVGFQPDIINLNDWQTALTCLYLRDFYSDKDFYQNIKSVFTIHNLQYQGIFNRNVLEKIFLNDSYFTYDKLEFYGDVSFMKSGILYSDRIVTVSPTYAEEIQTQKYGCGLENILQNRNKDIVGILNGIDYRKFNPQTDDYIFNFEKDSLAGKQKNKKALCREFDLNFDSNTAIMSVITRFAGQKGIDIICNSLERILKLDLQLVIVGTGDKNLENSLVEAQRKFPDNLRVRIVFDEELARKVYAGSDIFLMPSKFEPCGLAQIIAMRYGTVPIARKTGGLTDTITSFFDSQKKANGFLFDEYNSYSLSDTVEKIMSVYKNKSVWRQIMKNAMSCDFSWYSSAEKYLEVYRNTISV